MIRPAVRILSIQLFTLLLVTPAAAGTVTGHVVDPDGRPVPGATVLAISDGQPVRSSMTNTRGEFSIDALDGAQLELRIALAGFRTEIIRLEPSASRELGQIRLSVGAVSEGIVVSAAQVDIPLSETSSSVTVVTAAELQARQVRSVADALREVPGMSISAAGGHGAVTGLFPRGGESNFTLVMIDDVPVNAFGGEYDFGGVSTANVERIEVVRGPQSALFGSNAIGAVVRVVTRRGGAPSASATIEGGGYGTVRAIAATNGSAGQFDWSAAAERFKSDGYNGRRAPSGLTVENDDYDRTAGSVGASWRTGAATVQGFVRHETDERGNPGPFGANPIGAYGGIDVVSRGRNEQTTTSISLLLPVSPRIRTLVQTGYYRLDSSFDSPDFFNPGLVAKSEAGSRRWNVRAQADLSVHRDLAITAGAELQRERATSTFITGPDFTAVPVERRIAAYFGELRWNRDRRLLLTGGLRVDDFDREPLPGGPSQEDHVVSVNPRIAFAWFANAASERPTKVRASASTGIRPAGAFEIAFTNNPSLKPERSISGEAAIEQGLGGGWARIEAVAFYDRYDDLIVAVGSFTGSSRYTTDNIANARARGFELAFSAARRVAAPAPIDLDARVAYTLLDSEVLAVDDDDQAPPPFAVGEPLLRRPRHQFSAALTARVRKLTAFVSGRARGRALDVEPSFGTFGGLHDAPGFTVWNAGLSYRAGRFGEVFGRVENVFDRTYEEALGFPALGRRAMAGIRVAAGR